MKVHLLIDDINEALFGRETKRIQAWVDRLARQNQELLGLPKLIGIIHAGVVYRVSSQLRGDSARRAVHPSLTDEMERLVASRQKISNDKQFCSQALFMLLLPCRDLQDVRDALPDFLAQLLPELRYFERQRSPAWTIISDPVKHRSWRDMLPKLELYTAARLVY